MSDTSIQNLQANLTQKAQEIRTTANNITYNTPDDFGKKVVDIAEKSAGLYTEISSLVANVKDGKMMEAIAGVTAITNNVKEMLPEVQDVVSKLKHDIASSVGDVKQTYGDISNFIHDVSSIATKDIGNVLDDIKNGKFGQINDDLTKAINNASAVINNGFEKISKDIENIKNSELAKDIESVVKAKNEKNQEIPQNVKNSAKDLAKTLNEKPHSNDVERSSQQKMTDKGRSM